MKKKDILLLIIFVGIIFVAINVSAVVVSDGGTSGGGYTCTGVFGDEFIEAMNKYIYTPIKYLTPIALLVLTSIDFAGVVFSGDKKGMDKAKNNFLKRTVAALIIFFAPDIINLIVKLVNQQSISSCMNKLNN